MNAAAPIIQWLRGWHRGYKFGVLLIAAWAPFLFPASPMLTSVVMAIATTLFFVITGPRTTALRAESTIPHGTQDADS